MKNRLMALLALLVASIPCLGQLNRGTVTGTIADTSGAVIPGVRVSIRNAATGATYETGSSGVGQYNMPNLPTGSYAITFEVAGFKTLVREKIDVGTTEVVRVDVKLEVGSTSESVRITAEVPRLQTDAPEVATTLSSKQLIDLPLTTSGARKAETLFYKIAPGVTGSYWTSQINGSMNFSKETLLDGASATTYMPGDFAESASSLEALQEVKIQTSGISAEFGRFQSGVFNYIMKSGANEIHGSAYLGLRNEALNANTFANNSRGLPRAKNRERAVAASLGGPVYIPKLYDGRNRTFFYITHERYHNEDYTMGAPNRSAPLPEFYEGDFSRLLGPATSYTDALGRQVPKGAIYDPATFQQLPGGRWIGNMFPGNVIPKARFSQVSERLNAFAKQHILPTVRDASGQIPLLNNMAFPSANYLKSDYNPFSIKGDQNISSSQKLSGSYSYVYQPRVIADMGGLWDPNEPRTGGPLSLLSFQPLTSNFGRLAHDWIVSPRFLNHFTLFYNRFMTERKAAPDIMPSAKYDGLKEMGVTGLAPIAGFPTVNWNPGPFVSGPGIGAAAGGYNPAMGFGFLDTVSFTRGRHFMKAGFDFRRNHDNFHPVAWPTFNFSATGTAIPNEVFAGNYTGYGFASYLLGIVSGAGYSEPVGLGERRRYYGVFFQDDFKVSKKLSLNLGLRWDYQPPTSEVADRISSWNPNKIDPASGLPGAYDFAGSCNVCTGKHSFGSASLRNWGPRLGFAYRAFDKWTIRGAYGIMYEADLFTAWGIPGGKAGSVQVGGTYSLSADPVQPWLGAFNWDNGFPTNRFTPAAYDVSWANLNSAFMYDPDYGRTGYVQQWNLNIQREIIGHLVLEVGYVGNKGTGLRNGDLKRLNQLPASVLSTYGRNLSNAIRSPADAAANGIPYPYPGFQGTVATAIRQFPQVRSSTITAYGAPLGFSTYHSLQVVVNRQIGRGFGIYANYVWSKQMSNMSSAQIGANHGPLDYYHLGLEKAPGENNVPQVLKAYLDYQLPFGRGKSVWSSAGRIANAICGGWSLSGILNYSSGGPLGFGGSMPGSGWNGATNRANIAAGDMKNPNFRQSEFEYSTPLSPNNTYLNKSLFSDPPPLTLGTSAYRYIQVRGFARINEDLTLQKEHTIADKYRVQLRVDFLNAFNRHALGSPNTSVTSANFGQVTGASGNRQIQVGARLDF